MSKRILLFIFSFIFTLGVKAQIPVEWTAVEGISYDATNGILSKTALDGWNNAGARSLNRLDGNEDGIIKYTVDNITTRKAIGLSTKNNNHKIKSIDYAIVFNNNKISIYEKGKFRGRFGRAKLGDEFSVERKGNKILFKKNGRKFRQRNTNPQHRLFADVAIHSSGAVISGVTASFYKPLKISVVKSNVTCNGPLNGTIDVAVTGGKVPYTFLWEDGSSIEDRAGLGIGKYEVIVTDDLGRTKKRKVNIQSQVAWINMLGVVTVAGTNKLVKTPIDNQNPDKIGTATSQNTLLSYVDGRVVYEVDELAELKVFALTKDIGAEGLKGMDHAFYLQHDKLFIFENGKMIGEYGGLSLGDKLKIIRKGPEVRYKRNGVLIRKVIVDSSKELKVKVELYTVGSTFNNVRTDFCNLSLMTAYVATEETPTNLGSIELEPFGGTAPYYYFWSDGDQSKDRYSLESGYYSVIIVDTVADSLVVDIKLPTEAEFETLPYGLSFVEGQLAKAGAEGWTNGMATLQNQVSNLTEQGEIIVKIDKLGKEWIYGLREYSRSAASVYQELDYGFYIRDDNALFTYDAAGGLLSFGKVTTGDELSLEKDGFTIMYKKNDVVLRTTPLTEGSYKIDFSLKSNAQLGPIKIIKFHYKKIKATIIHSLCYLNTGSITANYNGISSFGYPTYTWRDANSVIIGNTQTVTGLAPGVYTITVKYGPNANHFATRTFEVGYKVNWTDQVLSTANGNSLTNNGGAYGSNGGASSNVLAPLTDGWAEFTVNDKAVDNLVFGLSDINQNLFISSIDYGVSLQHFVWNSAVIPFYFIIEGGVIRPVTGSFNTGDKFKIERIGNSIIYKKNSIPFYTTLGVINTTPLIVDVSMNVINSTVLNANVSKEWNCKDESFIYGHPKKKLEGGMYRVVNGKVYLKYREEYNSASTLKFNIYDDENNIIRNQGNLAVTTFNGYGDNRIEFDVYGSGIPAGNYILEVVNDKNEKWYLRFKY